MRVFVTLDDGLYRALQDRALKRGMSFHAVINEALARGLAEEDRSNGPGDPMPVKAQTRKKGQRGRSKSRGLG